MTSVMSWIFAAIAVSGALVATVVSDFRRVVLALWVAGLSVGAFYLTLGSEFLAVVQWLVSTLVAIAFLFFSVLFGEEAGKPARKNEKAYSWVISAFVGISFVALLSLGTAKFGRQPVAAAQAGDLNSLGKSLTEEHLISIEILALMLLMVLIGGGVVARPQPEAGDGDEEGGARA